MDCVAPWLARIACAFSLIPGIQSGHRYAPTGFITDIEANQSPLPLLDMIPAFYNSYVSLNVFDSQHLQEHAALHDAIVNSC